jgi:hypothetical protein
MKILNFQSYKLLENTENDDFFGMSRAGIIEFLSNQFAKIGYDEKKVSIIIPPMNKGMKKISIAFPTNIDLYIGILEDELGCFLVSPNLYNLTRPGIVFEFDDKIKGSCLEYSPKYTPFNPFSQGVVYNKINCENKEDFLEIVKKSTESLYSRFDNPSVRIDKSITINKTVKKNIEESFIEEYKKLIEYLKNPQKKLPEINDFVDDVGDLFEETIVKSIYEDPSLKSEFESLSLETRKMIFKNLGGEVAEPTLDSVKNIRLLRDTKAFLKRIYA